MEKQKVYEEKSTEVAAAEIMQRSLIRTFRSIMNGYSSPYERRMAKCILLELADINPGLFSEERNIPIPSLPNYPRTQTLMKKYSEPLELPATTELTVPRMEFDAERRLILTSIPEVFKQNI